MGLLNGKSSTGLGTPGREVARWVRPHDDWDSTKAVFLGHPYRHSSVDDVGT